MAYWIFQAVLIVIAVGGYRQGEYMLIVPAVTMGILFVLAIIAGGDK
jgi:hypothetical protein